MVPQLQSRDAALVWGCFTGRCDARWLLTALHAHMPFNRVRSISPACAHGPATVALVCLRVVFPSVGCWPFLQRMCAAGARVLPHSLLSRAR